MKKGSQLWMTLCSLIALISFSAHRAQAQQPSTANSTPCPNVFVQESGIPPKSFKVTVSPLLVDWKITYSWSVVNAKITSGQGTSTIWVEPEAKATSVTATVKIGGPNPACSLTASCSTIWEPAPEPQLLDRFGAVSLAKEQQRLAQLRMILTNYPGATLHVIVYGKDHSSRAQRVAKFFKQDDQFEFARLTIVTGEKRTKSITEFYLVPRGAIPPEPRSQP